MINLLYEDWERMDWFFEANRRRWFMRNAKTPQERKSHQEQYEKIIKIMRKEFST